MKTIALTRRSRRFTVRSLGTQHRPPTPEKNSPSRVRFRPPPRRTFGFRLRPTGVGSTYSRPVLGARGKLRAHSQLVNRSGTEILAKCDKSRFARLLVAVLDHKKFTEPGALSSSVPNDDSASAYLPSGAPSTYSRPVLGARANLGPPCGRVKAGSHRFLAICEVFLVRQARLPDLAHALERRAARAQATRHSMLPRP